MPVRIARILADARQREDGFTMLITVMTLLITSVLVAATLSAAKDDVSLVRNDLDQKKAYQAAKAGLSDYQFHLNQDANYWSSCAAPSGSVPGNPDETYAIALVPATGQSACDSNNPVTSMIESSGQAAGTFRIRSTGYSNSVHRSIVATLKRASFLNYVYYTVYETLPPSAYQSQSDRTSAATTCDRYWRDGRPPAGNQNYCIQIFWASGDVVNGPLHTEDELAICGSPVFGRAGHQPPDTVEVVAPAPGHSVQGNGGCSDNPTFNTSNGKLTTGANSIQPPPTNAQLKQIAASQYQFTGQTHIQLSGTTMTVTNGALNGGQPDAMPFPSNGVVYVSSSSCPTTYTPFGLTYISASGFSYSGAPGCGTLTVDGNYSSSLTLASDNDIVIDGNLTKNSSSSLLGLIAQNYVRIYHPCVSNVNLTDSLNNPQISAAILALTGSFIVDNYNCGAQLGSLSVTGVIAQVYRGPVGVIGTSGYLKNYTYDDNLRAEEPPHFLEPVQAAWHVERETECNGASTIPCP
jgi:Tfp pilus assembly protein PilX